MENKDKIKIGENGSLMKKTKSQLIEIILRKDAVEKELRKKFNEGLHNLENINSALCYKIRNWREDVKYYKTELYNKEEEFKELADEYANERQELKNIIKRYERLLIILSIIFLMIFSFMLY